MTNVDPTICPHCGEKMLRWKLDDDGDWGGRLRYVCFNNDCEYYVRGWEHTKATMNKPASYRHSYFPDNGSTVPVPVWSDEALREYILADQDGE